MGNARIGQEPFDIRLRQRREVAVDETENGDRNKHSAHSRQKKKWLEHAQKDDEASRLRTHRQIRGHRRRRALVNIRYPNMKGNGGDFKTKGDNNENAAEKCSVLLKAGPGKYSRNLLQIGFASCSKNPGNPVNEKTRRNRTENQIFYRRFQRGRIAPGKANQDIEGNCDQL